MRLDENIHGWWMKQLYEIWTFMMFQDELDFINEISPMNSNVWMDEISSYFRMIQISSKYIIYNFYTIHEIQVICNFISTIVICPNSMFINAWSIISECSFHELLWMKFHHQFQHEKRIIHEILCQLIEYWSSWLLNNALSQFNGGDWFWMLSNGGDYFQLLSNNGISFGYYLMLDITFSHH
jgi:hypothetical protein